MNAEQAHKMHSIISESSSAYPILTFQGIQFTVLVAESIESHIPKCQGWELVHIHPHKTFIFHPDLDRNFRFYGDIPNRKRMLNLCLARIKNARSN